MKKSTSIRASRVDAIAHHVVSGLKKIRRMIVPGSLEYAPLGWETSLQEDDKGWLSPGVLEEERRSWSRFVELLQGKGPLGFSHDGGSLAEVDNIRFHNLNYTYAYVVMTAAYGRENLSILDWGGGLGHYYLLAKALLPEHVRLDYHCKEVSTLVQAGREIAPEITWHQDDSCLDGQFDLVVMSGSLQYCRDWRALLQKVRKSTRRYFYLTRTPVVKNAATFVAVQSAYDTKMLHVQFNEDELLSEIFKNDFQLVREVVTGDLVYIKNAPEDAILKGWIFSV